MDLKARLVVALRILLVAVLVVTSAAAYYYYRTTRKSYLNTNLALQTLPGVEESGLYPYEVDSYGLAYRFTNGKARIVVPIDRRRPPSSLHLKIQTPRPRSVRHIPMTVRVNGQSLWNDPVPIWIWEKTFDLSECNISDELAVDIESGSCVPTEDKWPEGTTDKRKLGVQLLVLKLQRGS